MDFTLRRAIAFGILLLAAGCSAVVPGRVIGSGHPDFDFRNPPCQASDKHATDDELEVRYLGSGGVAIGWAGDVILVGPFFSNPSALRAASGRVRWDEERIDAGLAFTTLDRVRAVFAGHSHYDHLGDLPKIVERLPANVPVFVNEAGVNLLRPYGDLHARSVEKQSSPVRVTDSIRFQAFPSGHAPQFCLFGRHVCYRYADRDSAPRLDRTWEHLRYRDLARGVTHGFLIELLKGERVRYRLFYLDAASDARNISLPRESTVDILILCVPGAAYVRHYPSVLLDQLNPRHVVAIHYEDFFTKWRGAWRFVPGLSSGDVIEFLETLNAHGSANALPPSNDLCGPSNASWSMPVPRERLIFR